VLQIDVVLLTDSSGRERLAVRSGIVDRHFDAHIPEIGSRVPLDGMEFFRVGGPGNRTRTCQ
jgi:hypothetical protein